MKLWQKVLLALLLGVLTGAILGHDAEPLKILGTIFISLIKMVIVPLIFFAILSGITSMNNQSNFTRVGLKGFFSYITTAAFATAIGLLAGTIFAPGAGIDLHLMLDTAPSSAANIKSPPSISEFLLGLIPTNPIYAMSSDNFLQIIVTFNIVIL